MRNIELLSPCGDFERLKLALKFGADAVYLAGEMFGMRTNPSNFNADELKKAVTLAHSLGKKVYLTCNTLPRNEEIEKLPDFLKYAQQIGIDSSQETTCASKKFMDGVPMNPATNRLTGFA